MADSHLGGLDPRTIPALTDELALAPIAGRLTRASFGVFGLVPNARSSAAGVPVLDYGEFCGFTLTATNPNQHVALPTAVDKGSARIGLQIESKNAESGYLVIEPPAGETIDGETTPVAIIEPHDSILFLSDGVSDWHIEILTQHYENFNGFFDRAESTLSFDNGTRTLTLGTTGEYLVHTKGRPRVISANKTCQIDDTEGMHWIIMDEDGALQSYTSAPSGLITETTFVAMVYWDATNQVGIVKGDERHGAKMPSAVHLWAHSALGTLYDNGLGLTGMLTDESGDTDTHAQLGYASGLIRDEDIPIVIGAETAPAQIPVLYRSGASGYWRMGTVSNFPILTTGTGRAAYNQDTGSTWQLTEVGNGNFVLLHLVATNDIDYPVMCLLGQATYSTKSGAQNGALVELNALALGALESLFTEWSPLATVIVQTSNGYTNTVKSRFVTTEDGGDYIDWRGSRLGGASAGGSDTSVKPFIIMFSQPSISDDDQIYLEVVVPETFTLPAGLPQSYGNVWDTAATASTAISIQKNDVEVATATFGIAATTVTMAAAASTLFQAGVDKITIKGPATADITLAGWTLAIRGIR